MESPQRCSSIASFVLPFAGERVLLARHVYGPPVWALLGGMALPDEAPDVTARRELEEESGLAVEIDRLVAVCDIGDLLTFIFTGKVTAGVEHPQLDEIAELRWFSRTELDHTPVFQVVPLLLKTLAGWRGDAEEPPGLSRHMVAWPDGTPRPVYLVS